MQREVVRWLTVFNKIIMQIFFYACPITPITRTQKYEKRKRNYIRNDRIKTKKLFQMQT